MSSDFCQDCGYGQQPLEDGGQPELLWTDDDQALCILCSMEVVFCECGEPVQRLHVQLLASGEVCLACAAADVAARQQLAA